MVENLSIAGLCERDIDLLVLEETIASAGFRSLLTEAVGWESKNLELIRAERSVTESNGESDLEILFAEGSRRLKLLIENKVSAGFQHEQAVRYVLRGESYCKRGLCDGFATLLLAPRRYLGVTTETKGFNAVLAYEDLAMWFECAGIGERTHYKLAMLGSAIDRAVLGYQPKADASVTDFWKGYWKLSNLVAPQLQMKEPAGKPARSGFIAFAPAGLPKNCKLVHKSKRGYVDLQLRNLGRVTHDVSVILQEYLAEGMYVAKASESAAIRLNAPVLSTVVPIEAQSELASQGLECALRLFEWAKSVPGTAWAQCTELRERVLR